MAIADTLLVELAAPLADSEPCGPDLQYDPAFMAVHRAAQGTPEREAGGETKPAEPPDWRDVVRQSLSLLTRTRDLRVVVLLTRAWLTEEGFGGFAAGTELLEKLCTVYWDGVHPRAEDGDLTLRYMSLRSLNDEDFVLLPLRNLPIAFGRQGTRYTLRDYRIATGKLKPLTESADHPDRARIETIGMEAQPDALQATLSDVRRASNALAALQKLIDAKSPGEGIEFAPLQADLREISRSLEEIIARRSGLDPAAVGGGEAAPAAAALAPVASAPGVIGSRAEVVRALDAICVYYREREPSSPVPMLITRAKRLVNLSFLEIIRDLTPGGFNEASLFSGTENDNG